MDIVALFTGPGPYVLGIGIFILTFFTRRVVELGYPKLRKQADANLPKITYLTPLSRWWNEFLLYLIPVVYGCLAGLSSSEFLFTGIPDPFAKILFGGGVGWFASTLYKLVRRLMIQKAGLDPLPESLPPEPMPPDA